MVSSLRSSSGSAKSPDHSDVVEMASVWIMDGAYPIGKFLGKCGLKGGGHHLNSEQPSIEKDSKEHL